MAKENITRYPLPKPAVELVSSHEAGYLEHGRRYAMECERK